MATCSKKSDEEQLTFTNYDSTVQRSFVDMFRKQELTDVTLICESKPIRAHKFLLSAASSFFNNIFKNSAADSTHHIKNVTHALMLAVLEYIYEGQVAIDGSQVAAFLDAAKQLSVSIDTMDLAGEHNQNSLSNRTENESSSGESDSSDEEDAQESDSSNRSYHTAGGAGVTATSANGEPSIVETIRINKNENNGVHPQQPSNGIVELSREEFLARLLKEDRPKPKFSEMYLREHRVPVTVRDFKVVIADRMPNDEERMMRSEILQLEKQLAELNLKAEEKGQGKNKNANATASTSNGSSSKAQPKIANDASPATPKKSSEQPAPSGNSSNSGAIPKTSVTSPTQQTASTVPPPKKPSNKAASNASNAKVKAKPSAEAALPSTSSQTASHKSKTASTSQAASTANTPNGKQKAVAKPKTAVAGPAANNSSAAKVTNNVVASGSGTSNTSPKISKNQEAELKRRMEENEFKRLRKEKKEGIKAELQAAGLSDHILKGLFKKDREESKMNRAVQRLLKVIEEKAVSQDEIQRLQNLVKLLKHHAKLVRLDRLVAKENVAQLMTTDEWQQKINAEARSTRNDNEQEKRQRRRERKQSSLKKSRFG